MPRYQLTIAYDGSDFCGWQKQEPHAEARSETASEMTGEPAGGGQHAFFRAPPAEKVVEQLPLREGEDRPRVALRTVQHVVERAVREVVREPVLLQGASRTDSGVHALGQVAAFTCSDGEANAGETRGGGWPEARGADRLVRAINGKLPEDVLVLDARAVAAGFDPVRDCLAKSYSYTLHVGPTRPLFERRMRHWVYDALDVAAMRDAAARFVGEHDFAGFAAAGHGRLSTVRTIFACGVEGDTKEGIGASGQRGSVGVAGVVGGESLSVSPSVRITVTGSGFLYNMVRIISGTLLEVGRGRMKPEAVTHAIQSKDRRDAGPTLPACGLCLEWIRYPA